MKTKSNSKVTEYCRIRIMLFSGLDSYEVTRKERIEVSFSEADRFIK